MAKFLDRWVSIIAGMIMLCILFAVLTGYGPTRSSLCKPNELCLREWVSALSGWAGAVAASVTLLFLWRQITTQERQHREQLFLAKGNELDALRAVVDYCDSLIFVESAAKTRGSDIHSPSLNALYRVSMHTSHQVSGEFSGLAELITSYNASDREAVAIYGDSGDGSTNHGFQCVMIFGKAKVLCEAAKEQIRQIMLLSSTSPG